MANNIIGTVGIGAQSVKPDWNQNDPNAKDYIKNRPGGYVIPPSVEIAWDGDTTGKETIDLVGIGSILVKIADEAPPIEKFALKSDVATFTGKPVPRYTATITVDVEYNNGEHETKQLKINLQAGDGFWLSGDDEEEQIAIVIGVVADHVSINGYTFSKGLWFSVFEEVRK